MLMRPDTARFPQNDGQDAALALALLKAMPGRVCLLDPDGRVTFVNGAGLRSFEPSEAVQGRFWWDLWPAADREVLRTALVEAAAGETVTIEAGPSDRGWQQMVVAPVEDARGTLVKILVIAREACDPDGLTARPEPL
ncbi:PAS domain-containing protein [Paracoccus sp. S-4012]|uniref:PAS domain-containing protein n=1 Tax=Paracoccus sp. S-4012 TaxID=2665648 RepID=UPI0012B08959|nr:PAS domain-containing protein [Paracoccus sp. S-4012]MRX50079.1 PAS domain-containing protein [Paracoccus sp. S-4012]